MKLNDETVLEPLHVEPADLSSSRWLVKGAAIDAAEDLSANLTRSVLEFRGIISRAAVHRMEEAPADNAAPSLTQATGFNPRVPELAEPPPVVWVPVVSLSRGSFEVLQKFEGTVLSVTDDSFVARLVDRTHSGPEEEAEIPLAEIMPGDQDLVKAGAMFYWVMGYRREAHGQVSRSSVIRFRRMPMWSPADVERAKKEAETFLSFLDLERANHPA